jgi:hypothetical protein
MFIQSYMHQVPCAAPKAGGESLTGALEVESSVGYINEVGCEHWTEGCYRYRAIPASAALLYGIGALRAPSDVMQILLAPLISYRIVA